MISVKLTKMYGEARNVRTLCFGIEISETIETNILDAFRHLIREEQWRQREPQGGRKACLVARAHGRVRVFQSLFQRGARALPIDLQRGALPLGVGARTCEVCVRERSEAGESEGSEDG